MPELPEVQTVIDSLKDKLAHQRILSYHELWHKVIYTKNKEELNFDLKSNIFIKSLKRLGKYIIIILNKKFIIFHLRMTGYLYYSNKLPENKLHLRCFFKLSNKDFLIYEDIRKFGGFYYLHNIETLYNRIGIDPINNNDFGLKWMQQNIPKKSRMIKALLLDQSFICGLGNIYIDEILWSSKIHPKHLSNTISKNRIKILFLNIEEVLKKSIKYHGTTIINFKFDNMKTGDYKNYLNVYNRENKACYHCSYKISKIKVSGRSTYICSKCQ